MNGNGGSVLRVHYAHLVNESLERALRGFWLNDVDGPAPDEQTMDRWVDCITNRLWVELDVWLAFPDFYID